MIEQFSKELEELQKKHDLTLFAVNQVQNNGEVIPVIKVALNNQNVNKKKYETNTKKGNISNKKA